MEVEGDWRDRDLSQHFARPGQAVFVVVDTASTMSSLSTTTLISDRGQLISAFRKCALKARAN
jgi:hypothetical protein